MLMVGGNAGLIGMSKEHLGVALALNVPIAVCVTKVRQTPSESNSADCVDRHDTAKYPRTDRQHVGKGAQVARLQESAGLCGQRSASCGLRKVPRAASGTW